MTTGRPRGQLTRWTDHLGQHLPHLSKPQRTVLALWTYAATLTEHVGSTTCAAFLAETLGESENTLRQRLREFYRPAAVKRGPDRRDLDVRLAFGPLLAWALALLRPPELVLALDPTLCRDRLAVLTVAVVAHGCAIPVAWVAVRANEPGAWMPHWLPMLAALAAVVPRRTRVVVVADRGLQSTALFAEIVALGWHPMIRLTRVGMWRERGAPRWTALAALPLRPGEHYVMRGHVFATRPHACTLVAVWRLGFDAPWLLMTDLPPQRCERAFYGLRCWRRGCAARTGLPVPEVGWAAMRAAADHGAGAGRAGVAGAVGVALVDARGRCGTGAGGDGRRRRPPDAECAPPGVDPTSGRRASRSTASTAAPGVCSVAPNPDAGRDGETAVVNTYPCQPCGGGGLVAEHSPGRPRRREALPRRAACALRMPFSPTSTPTSRSLSPSPHRRAVTAPRPDSAAVFTEALRRHLPDLDAARVRRDVRLAPYTTFRIGGPADAFFEPHTADELAAALGAAREADVPVFRFGLGANILVGDAGFRGVVVRNRADGIRIDGTRVVAESGAIVWPDLIEATVAAGLSGLEHYAGIPSTVGGALWQNLHFLSPPPARERTMFIEETVESADLLSPTGERHTVDRAWFAFGYDYSTLHDAPHTVLSATFRLDPADETVMRETVRANLEWRASRHPPLDTEPSAGSIFKKIDGVGAGRLADGCGLKGCRIGGAVVTERHANIVVNTGVATARDVRHLIGYVQETVAREMGYRLSPEVGFVGDFGRLGALPARGWENADGYREGVPPGGHP